jgi:hypothetical protein
MLEQPRSAAVVQVQSAADRYCGARTRPGAKNKSCRRPAGWGTAHVGHGRCKLHGGSTPIRSGRYSSVKREDLRVLIEQFQADPDPLDILPELAAARALFQDFIERHDSWRAALLAWHESFESDNRPAKPRQLLDIGDAYRILGEVTKTAERIERIRSQNAISRPDLYRVFSELWRIVERHIDDPGTRKAVRDGWLSIRI